MTILIINHLHSPYIIWSQETQRSVL